MTALDYSGDLYYRRSGRAPMFSTTVGAIGSWVVITLLAALYAYADLYIKVVDKLSVLILIAFAVAMGFAVYWILRWAKVRNFAVIGIIALSCAALGLYVSWVVWEFAIFRRDDLSVPLEATWELFRRPDIVFAFAQEINEIGTFTMRNKAITGGELWLFWIVEAIVLVGCITLIPLLAMRGLAFCETCSAWCKKETGTLRVQHHDEDELRRHMEAKDIAHLARVGPADSDTPVHLRVDLYDCPSCAQMHLMTVNRVAVTYDKKGQRSESATKVIDRLCLDEAQASELRDIPAQWSAAAAAAAASTPETSPPADSPADSSSAPASHPTE